MSEKPVIFISHAHEDADLANAIQRQLEIVLNQRVRVFNSSNLRTIQTGQQWVGEIVKHIDAASAFILLMTPSSLTKEWVWFEIGAFWQKFRGEGLFPIASGLSANDLPVPFKDIQYSMVNDEASIGKLFTDLITHLQFGEIRNLDHSLIKQAALRNTQFYKTSPKNKAKTPRRYEGLDEGTLREKVREYVHEKYLEFHDKSATTIVIQQSPLLSWAVPIAKQNSIFAGKMAIYRELDTQIGLPDGASKKFLKDVCLLYGLLPVTENQDSITFRYSPERNQYQSE